jgi:hypothetical protein
VSRRWFSPALAITLLFLSCRRAEKSAPVSPPAKAPLPSESLLPATGFQPPADGLLTEKQVDDFLRVRRAAKGRTDAESARALGVSTDEVAWTRARIIEALVALDDRRVRDASAEAYAKAIAALRQARQSTRDPARARTLDDQVAAMERERAAIRRGETPAPAAAENMRRVARRRAEIEALAP